MSNIEVMALIVVSVVVVSGVITLFWVYRKLLKHRNVVNAEHEVRGSVQTEKKKEENDNNKIVDGWRRLVFDSTCKYIDEETRISELKALIVNTKKIKYDVSDSSDREWLERNREVIKRAEEKIKKIESYLRPKELEYLNSFRVFNNQIPYEHISEEAIEAFLDDKYRL